MIQSLSLFSGLDARSLIFVALAVFAAGLVRGFSGFGLSAVVMASATVMLPPVELIPVCFVLETAASVVMFRGGLRHADMDMVKVLVIGSAIGLPAGLLATTTIDPDLSRKAALTLILVLTVAQFLRLAPHSLATRKGLYATSLGAGVATGLASVGGMVIALYILASRIEPKRMRASLVMYLAISMAASLIYYLAYGVLTAEAFRRGILLAPLALCGVGLGSLMFRPAHEHLYKTICLLLLSLLSLTGLVRLVL